jgi:hypothetical protein
MMPAPIQDNTTAASFETDALSPSITTDISKAHSEVVLDITVLDATDVPVWHLAHRLRLKAYPAASQIGANTRAMLAICDHRAWGVVRRWGRIILKGLRI